MDIDTKQLPQKLQQEIIMTFQGCKPQGHLRPGLGSSEKVGQVAKTLVETGPVLLMATPSMKRLGVAQKLQALLEQAGLETDMFTDILPEPKVEGMLLAAKAVKAKPYTLVVGLGGGSALDTAKMTALFATSAYDPMTLMRDESLCTEGLPTILLPTTSGAGSEISPFIVISDNGDKFFVDHPCVYGTVAIVDPLLTATMSPRITAATGLDALTHGVEGVCGANMANPYSMALSERCVELVFHWLPVAVREPQNLEARYYMSFAAVLGMMAYIQGGGLYAHSMSYILTKHLGLPHGMGCGITLPYTLEYNSAYLDAVLVQYGKVLFGKQVPKEEVLKAFRDLVVRVGMPASLREAGMKQEDIDMFAHELHDENYRKKNPREMSMEQARQFMKAMYEGTSGECH